VNISARKAITRGITAATLVAAFGIGATACSSSSPDEPGDVETPDVVDSAVDEVVDSAGG
jgi:hypothetical protein